MAATLDDNPALVIGLQCAVQLDILELARLDPATRDAIRVRWAADAVDPIASGGDALQFGGKTGEAAKVFNALAKGLAAGAYQPGGITAFGMHWCVDHQQCLDAEAGIRRETAPDHNPDEPDDEPEEPTYDGRPLDTITPSEAYL